MKIDGSFILLWGWLNLVLHHEVTFGYHIKSENQVPISGLVLARKINRLTLHSLCHLVSNSSCHRNIKQSRVKKSYNYTRLGISCRGCRKNLVFSHFVFTFTFYYKWSETQLNTLISVTSVSLIWTWMHVKE